MTEFQELVKDVPKFNSMEHGELVICAYAMYAAWTKVDAENAKLRELVRDIYEDMWHGGEWLEPYDQRMRELGIEVSV